MAELHYQELNLLQIFDVLRHARIARLAVSRANQPYVVPMRFQLEVRGKETILHLISRDGGRKMDTLRVNDRVCLEIELPGCAWVDTVVIQGRATVGIHEPGKAVELCVAARHMTGRRYFQPE